MRRGLLNLLTVLSLLLFVAAWLASYAVAVEWTFRPVRSRWCQGGVNFGTVFFATRPWPGNVTSYGLLVYDARPRGTRASGFGFYFSRSGTTPGGTGNVCVASVPLWVPVAILAVWRGVGWEWARRRAHRTARRLCPSCGYDLREGSLVHRKSGAGAYGALAFPVGAVSIGPARKCARDASEYLSMTGRAVPAPSWGSRR